MKVFKRFLIAVVLACLLVSAGPRPMDWLFSARNNGTFPLEENPPERKTMLSVDYVTYKWWLIRWKDNSVACEILTEHEGLPKPPEVLFHCGENIYSEWVNTRPCEQVVDGHTTKCSGFYIYLVSKTPAKRQIEVDLPLPKVWVAIHNCEPELPENRCTSQPGLLLTGEEPLPNETIIRLQGTFGGQPFTCPAERCTIPLFYTGSQGVPVEFWADSSYGDSSEHFSALVRVLPQGDFMAPEGPTDSEPVWYVDVLSTMWRGPRPASCSETWQVFTDVGGPSLWLTSPNENEELASSVSYYYLAAMLIQNGVVDARACPNHGLESSTTASACGLELALPAVQEWQNRFDSEIQQVSSETGVPSQLLKNIFSRESQFWPGIYTTYEETGLGQMTVKGADTVLLWNPSFFEQFCPLVLDKEKCQLGFGNLGENSQQMLRGAVVNNVNAACAECPAGINLTQANFSVRVFAESLLAGCEQVGQLVRNITGRSPGEESSYEDLWRFTLVNYNAGAGCLGDAITKARTLGLSLTWDNVSANLDPVCQGAIGYVKDISQDPVATPTVTPWFVTVAPTQTPQPTISEPTLTLTPEPIVTLMPTSTPEPELPGEEPSPTPTVTSTLVTPYP